MYFAIAEVRVVGMFLTKYGAPRKFVKIQKTRQLAYFALDVQGVFGTFITKGRILRKFLKMKFQFIFNLTPPVVVKISSLKGRNPSLASGRILEQNQIWDIIGLVISHNLRFPIFSLVGIYPGRSLWKRGSISEDSLVLKRFRQQYYCHLIVYCDCKLQSKIVPFYFNFVF